MSQAVRRTDALRPRAPRQLAEVVDLAVEGEPVPAVGRSHRLVTAGGRIHDRQPADAQRDVVACVEAGVVGTAMAQGCSGLGDPRRVFRGVSRAAKSGGESAHEQPNIFRCDRRCNAAAGRRGLGRREHLRASDDSRGGYRLRVGNRRVTQLPKIAMRTRASLVPTPSIHSSSPGARRAGRRARRARGGASRGSRRGRA